MTKIEKKNGLNRIDGSADRQYWKISYVGISAVVGIKKISSPLFETFVQRIRQSTAKSSSRVEKDFFACNIFTREQITRCGRIEIRRVHFRLEIGERNSAPTSVTIELRRIASWRNYIL